MLSYLMSRQNISVSSSFPKSGKITYNEDEVADKARERRLKERLRKWENGDSALQDELPPLYTSSEGEESNGRGSGVVIVGGDSDGGAALGLPPILAQALGARMSGRSGPSEGERATKFYRTSFIVPGVRSLLMEKACRVDRRREINELTIRMGVTTVGGALPPMGRKPDDPSYAEKGAEVEPAARRLWEDWGREIEVWSNVLKIADRAVGKAIAASVKSQSTSAKPSLEPVSVDWNAVYEAWAVHRATQDMRKAWIQHSLPKVSDVQAEGEEGRSREEEQVDEVIERLKRDPDLDQHEQRLLGCIVDTGEFK